MHPSGATRPQALEAKPSTILTHVEEQIITAPTVAKKNISGSTPPTDTAVTFIPKPLTPKEKVEAITPKEEQNPSRPDKIPLLSPAFSHAGGYLPVAHRASKAPAKQNLELRHGRSSLRNLAVV